MPTQPLGDQTQFLPATSLPAVGASQNTPGNTSSDELAGAGEQVGAGNGTLSRAVTLAQSPFQTPATPAGLAVVEIDTIANNPGNANVVVVSPPGPAALQEWIVKVINGNPAGPQAPVLLRPDGVSAMLVEDPSQPGTLRTALGTLASLKSGPGTSGRWYFDPPSAAWRLSATI